MFVIHLSTYILWFFFFVTYIVIQTYLKLSLFHNTYLSQCYTTFQCVLFIFRYIYFYIYLQINYYCCRINLILLFQKLFQLCLFSYFWAKSFGCFRCSVRSRLLATIEIRQILPPVKYKTENIMDAFLSIHSYFHRPHTTHSGT